MAINLNPKADGALINAAYRSAAGNAPADYSKTLQSAADSYDKTMEAQGEAWGNFAKLGAKIGGEMMANAEKLTKYAAAGAGLNPDDADMFTKEIYGIKDELNDLGIFSGKLGNRETRIKRQELLLKQKELFAEIDAAALTIQNGTQAVAAGLYDANIDEMEAESINAIIKSGLKDNVTDEKNIAKLSRDETTGELIYTIYDVSNNPDGEVIINPRTGKPQTMTLDQFTKAISTNADDKGLLKANLNKLNDEYAKMGNSSLDGVFDPQMQQLALNKLDNMLKTPTDLKRAMRTQFGYSETSFFDDIQKPSTLSAGLYSTLLKATGAEGGVLSDADGSITKSGTVDGKILEYKDVDGQPGVSQADLQNANNYAILSANILGMKDPDASKKFFKDYTVRKLEEAYNYGFSKKPPKVGGGGTDTETGGFVSLGGGAGKQNYVGSNTTQGYVPNSALNFIGKSANDRADIDLGKDKYIWDEKNGVYTLDGVPINNKSELFTVIYGENFDPSKIINMYNSIKDWQGETRQKETFDKGTNLDVGFVNKADQTVAAELNDIIPSPGDTRNPNAYIFKPLATFENMTGIYKEGGKIETFPEVYPEGHPKAGEKHPRAGAQAWFRTKGKTTKLNAQNLAEMIDLLQTFGLYDYIEKQLP
tara:strand:- start:641 stop:2590 length:1950 start_codon:yes stop_codon:yes gene_type:complete